MIGGEEITLKPQDHVVTPPDTAHFTISHGLVLAVVNTPPFDAGNYVALTSSDPRVGFDQDQLNRLNT